VRASRSASNVVLPEKSVLVPLVSAVYRVPKTASYCTGEARMAFTAHWASHWCPSKNSQRLPESSRNCGTTATFLGKAHAGKTGQRCDPRLYCGFSRKPDLSSNPSSPSVSVCEAYRELIEQGLAQGRNGKAIWQDLVSDHGFAGGYQAVKGFDSPRWCDGTVFRSPTITRLRHPMYTLSQNLDGVFFRW